MFELKVKNHRGEMLTLTNNPNYTVYKIEGLSPPQSTVNSSVNTTSDGSVINAVRLNSRNIVIYVAMEGNVETNRINLYKYFPVKKTVTLYYANGTRDVCINGVVEIIECDFFTNKQVAQISILCPKPYFKAVEDNSSSFSDISSLFEFPFAISAEGVEISAITHNIRKSIVNVGDTDTGAIINLFATGAVVNPIIYDVLKRTKMALNFTMQTSDNIIINTNFGEKSIKLIRNGITTDIMGYLSKDSNWITLEAGDNLFTYDCESGNSSLDITFTTSVLYAGV